VLTCAVALAYIGAAAEVYLRAEQGVAEGGFGGVAPGPRLSLEVGLEVAMLVLVAGLAWFAGRRGWTRVGYFGLLAGLSVMFYYGWLVLIAQWPLSLLAWDVVSHLPVPWHAPVLAVLLMAGLLAAGGTWAIRLSEVRGRQPLPSNAVTLAIGLGALLAAYACTAESLAALALGVHAVRLAKPETFPWPVFLVGYGLLAGGLVAWLTAEQPMGRD
jgi:hypothetical protein